MNRKKILATLVTVFILSFSGCKSTPDGNHSRIIGNSTLEMVYVEAGSFEMGSNSGLDDEKPVHMVTLTNDFLIGKYEVTQELYKEVMGNNPAGFKGEKYPVEMVSWYDALDFCNALSEKEGLSPYYNVDKTGILKWTVTFNSNATGYRLPTEAQWVFAARGGNKSKGYKYSGSNNIDDVARYAKSPLDKGGSIPVGTNKPNELGIYDMSGNVYEWCQDWYGKYKSDSQMDPVGIPSGSLKISHGGSWYYFEKDAKISARNFWKPEFKFLDIGFRVLLPVAETVSDIGSV